MRLLLPTFIGLLFMTSLSSCLKDSCKGFIVYEIQEPITMAESEYRKTPSFENAREIERPGKIYYYQDYILLNEYQEGIHFINNTVPSNPINERFLPIPGNVDVAVKNGILFADNFTDIISLDISDLSSAIFLNRVENVYPNHGIDEHGNVIIGYNRKSVVEEVDCNNDQIAFLENAVLFDSNFGAAEFASNSNKSVGIGGSLARFAIYSDYLYAIDDSNLKVIDIGDGSRLNRVSDANIGWGIETLFGHDHKLFVGGNVGMSIYGLDNPEMPNYLGGYEHIFSCDPVYVKDNFAYVTLHSDGNWCGQGLNQLDLVDISDPTNVQLIKSFPMTSPHGLSINGNNLFLCEGEHGLKVYDISTPTQLHENLRYYNRNTTAIDVITLPTTRDIILVVGVDGIAQYDYSDPNNLTLISELRLPL